MLCDDGLPCLIPEESLYSAAHTSFKHILEPFTFDNSMRLSSAFNTLYCASSDRQPGIQQHSKAHFSGLHWKGREERMF